jgi:hypothetical protein
MQNTQDLLPFLLSSPHKIRIQKLLELGRASAQDLKTKEALAGLSNGDSFARRCALISCFTSRDGEMILRFVSDSSRSVRGLALRMVAKFCSDAQVSQALHLAQQRRQHMPIIRELARSKRVAPLDLFIKDLAEKNDPALSSFLSYASKDAVKGLFQKAISLPSILFWRRFSLRHADLIATYFIERLSKSAELPDPRLRWDLAAAFPAIVERAPTQAFEIMAYAYRLNIPETKSHLSTLANAHPQETFDWLEKNKLSFLLVSFEGVALQLKHEQLIRLLRDHRSALGDPRQWFAKEIAKFSRPSAKDNVIKYWMLAHPDVIDAWLEKQHTLPLWGSWFFLYVPAEKKQARDQAYERWSIASRDKFGIISPHTLTTLPWELREREARRHITEVGKLQTQPILRLQYYPLLPWVEALEHLKPWLSHPEPEIRIQGMQVFLQTFGKRIKDQAATDAEIGEALELIKSRRFEQDPVRLVMLEAIAGWPRNSWRPSHVEALGEICQAALDASDLSGTTAHHLGATLKNIFVLDQARAVAWYLQLYHNRGHVESAIGGGFSKEEVAAISSGLLQIAKRFVERGAHGMMISLANSLGEKIIFVPALAPLLRDEVLRSHDRSALSILLVYYREIFDEILPEIYTQSKSKESKISLLFHCLTNCPKRKLDGVLLQLTIAALYNKKWHEYAGEFLVHMANHIEPAQVVAHIKQLYESYAPPLGTIRTKSGDQHFDAGFVSFLQRNGRFLREAEIEKIAIDVFESTNHYGHSEALAASLCSVLPDKFRSLAPRWISQDASVVILPTIHNFLDRERHDLLLPMVQGVQPEGRFTGESAKRWLFPVQSYARYWAPNIQEVLASTLDRELLDEKKNIPELIGLVERRVALPFASAAGLFPFAKDSRNALKEKVIRVIARLDAGQGVPTLLDCLGDDRARYAIYGFRKAILEMPAVAVFDILRQTPLKKVTVAKELMRLLGEMKTDAAYEFMLSLHKTQKLHRDVRIAQLRALWDHLEKPQTWEVFSDAVSDPDWILASKLSDLPLAQLTSDSEKKMSALFARLLQRPEPEARVAMLQKIKHLPLVDAERKLYKACLERCASEYSQEFEAAMEAVLYRARTQDTHEVASVLAKLMPKRRQFFSAFGALLRVLTKTNQVIYEIARSLLRPIATDPLLTREYLRLTKQVCVWGEAKELLLSLEQKGLLTIDTFTDATSLLLLANRQEAMAAEEGFRAHESPMMRRLGLSLLMQLSSTGHGWIQSRRALLEVYQNDSSPIVASEAIRILPEEK